MIISAFLIAIFAIFVIGFLETVTTDKQISTNHLRNVQAMYIADAGIEACIYRLLAGGNGAIARTEFPDTEADNSYYTVTVTDSCANLTTVLALGEYADSQAMLAAKIRIDNQSATLIYWKEI